MAFLIDTIDSSGLFAQSANSATIATKDSNGNDITATYQPSGDYYSASNPSGFMTELPASATDVIDTVTANSGTWGGSALPISAGPGIKVNLVDNTLVFSTDETVLWEGTYNGSVGSANAITMSEPLTNFSKIQFEMGGVYHSLCNYNSIATHFQVLSPFVSPDGGTTLYAVMYQRLGDNKIYRNGCGILNNAALTKNAWINNSTGAQGECTLVKVIGINRISGGN